MTWTHESPTLFREVWRIERQIDDHRRGYQRIGHDAWPAQELVHFRASQRLGHAAQDVVESQPRPLPDGYEAREITVDVMGLTGARGALPPHYTELVQQQTRDRSPALKDFLDIFNHRLLSLFYRSWEKTQPAVEQERTGEDRYTQILRVLTNCANDWEIYYGAAMARSAQSAASLRDILADVTGIPVAVHSLQGGWHHIDPQDQTQLPNRRQPDGLHAHLGEAVLGGRVWMADQGVKVVFRPQNGQAFQSLLPGGRVSSALSHISRRLVGVGTRIEMSARVAANQLQGARLGVLGTLGIDGFLGTRSDDTRTVEVSFKPGKG